MPHKVKCPVCHSKVIPLPMARGDTKTIFSKDGNLLEYKAMSGANKGIIQETCYNCGYVIGEHK